MPTQMVHVILNPASGGGRAGRLRAEIDGALRARGLDVVLHGTRASGHARELAQLAVNAGAEIVAAAGGDGTLHEVANGLLCAGTQVPLAVIPIGTGNDFAKVVPGAHTRQSAYDIIAQGRTHLFDAGLATWQGGREYFINAMGTGIDVEVVRQILRLPALPGPIKYLLGLLRALTVYKPVTLRATLPHEVIERTVMMFAVGNGVCQGGGFYLTPHARADDRLLELCVVRQIPLWQVPFVLPLVLRGTHADHAAVTMRSFEQIRFESVDGRSLFFQLDGELREPPDAHWLDVEIRPAVLPVVVRG
ncbi:MAG TPA: diacylglycerol kinase family protein [Longimicrobiales bacterium]